MNLGRVATCARLGGDVACAGDPAAPSSALRLRRPRARVVLEAGLIEVRSAEVPKRFLDVTVRHPWAKDLREQAWRVDGAAALAAVKDKARRYCVHRDGVKVTTFAVEWWGHLGADIPQKPG